MEIAAAVLIAAGIFRLVAIALAFANPNPPFPIDPVIAVAETALQVLTITIGLLIRTGRAWIAAVNVVAVLAFIEILSLPSPVSLALAVLFGLAFAATFLNKPWFDERAAWRARSPDRSRA